MCAAGSCWIAPGKPLPVAYACSTMLFVRFDSDCSAEWPPLAARHDDLSTPCVCAELGGRVRACATAVAPHSRAYQVLSELPFKTNHRYGG